MIERRRFLAKASGRSPRSSRAYPLPEWFATVPFGMDPQGVAVWYYHGDRLKLWEETRGWV